MGLSDWLSKDAPQKDVPMESTSFSNEMVIFCWISVNFDPQKYSFDEIRGLVTWISRNSNAKYHFDQYGLRHVVNDDVVNDVVIPQLVSSTDLTLDLIFNLIGNLMFSQKLLIFGNFHQKTQKFLNWSCISKLVDFEKIRYWHQLKLWWSIITSYCHEIT